MKKKILGIAVAIVMLFAVAGLAACELNNPYTRHPNSDESIDASLENAIRSAFSTEPLVWYVFRYYGTFDEASVVMMGSTENFPGDMEWKETVAGITFFYGDTRRIIVWYENYFYTLQEAFEHNILTQENLQVIANINNLIATTAV
ncbi:MAG: hypothetical protein FWC82_00575 [Firmicutes bacterium]|nr:hypothetical protein [Bacillota bacterium]